MKKLFIPIVLCLAFCSCNQVVDAFLTDCASGHDLFYMEEWEELESFYDIGDWISDHVVYRSDDIYMWSNPRDTVSRGYGDCNDMALLFANIAYYVMGIKMEIVVVDQSLIEFQPVYSIEGGGFVDHCILRYNGQLYSSSGWKRTGPVGFYYTFDHCFGR